MMRTLQHNVNQNIFENVRIKPDVIVRCRRSGVYIIHILSSTPQLHWKSRKYILSQRILNDASCCHDDQISLSHLGAYCIVVAYSKLYDHHQINDNFCISMIWILFKYVQWNLLSSKTIYPMYDILMLLIFWELFYN